MKFGQFSWKNITREMLILKNHAKNEARGVAADLFLLFLKALY